ncbi:uncharacterized protein LOC114282353 [Camellia sinensis]|uniref:uncharacterized protein LOC114282353 n=1 Tax=Camellia sinensis TaxID=4442 RepID=UPI001036D00E|nr:uncharacterized protein LOC114282353 [Camellia sinensis]
MPIEPIHGKGFIVMENSLFLMCKFRGVTLVIKYNDGFNFKDLVYKLCAMWSELVGSSLNILYSMPRHSCYGLQSEEDLEVMVELALSCDIHPIDVFVKCCSLGEGYMMCDGEAGSSSSSNDKDSVTIHCKRMADLGCLWNMHARVKNSSKTFVIKQFDDVHMCGSSFRTIKHTRMTSSMIGGLISSEVRNKALTSVSEVICDCKDYYGTEVSYWRAWMGVEKTRDVIFGDYSSSFDDLRWYVDVANDCNPGSVFDMKFDINSKGRHFKCMFFAFEACIHAFKYCWPVLMLDESFLKGRHKGCLLAVTAKDVINLLCIDSICCMLLLNCCSNTVIKLFMVGALFVILTPGRDIMFVTNQHGGLLKALAKTNLQTYLSVKSRESKEYLLTLFSRCAYAPTIELFNELFEEFKGCCGRSAQKFLEDLPNECWCDSYFQEKKLEETFNDTKAWIVKKCSDDIHEIQLDHSVMVDIGKRSCSCRLLKIDSFPCKHGFCAIKRSENDLNCFLDDYYRVCSYCDSCPHSIYPIPNMWKPNVVLDDDVVLPPLCKKPAGRPRTERIPSKGEIKRIRCSRCGKMGTHNRKTCKEALL